MVKYNIKIIVLTLAFLSVLFASLSITHWGMPEEKQIPYGSREGVRYPESGIGEIGLAIEVLESEASALHWLKRPQIGLGRKVPLALLATDPGRDQVEKLLLRIEHGVYS